MVIQGGQGAPNSSQQNQTQPNQQPSSSDHQPPQQAIDACSGKQQGATCSITTPQGMLSGTCKTPPNASLACVPQ